MIFEIHVEYPAEVVIFCAEDAAKFVSDSVQDLVDVGDALKC